MSETKREKRYVPVVVRFDAEGQLRPLETEFDEEHKYAVDRVLDVYRAACQTVGGVGYAIRSGCRDRSGICGLKRAVGLLRPSAANRVPPPAFPLCTPYLLKPSRRGCHPARQTILFPSH